MQDEAKIRDVVERWMNATVAGEVENILPLMSEDVVFLAAGNPPIRGREAFASGLREILQHVRIEPESDIQEIKISGDMAYCWNYLTVNVLPLAGGAALKRTGFALTVLRKNSAGEWQVTRDANLLSEEA